MMCSWPSTIPWLAILKSVSTSRIYAQIHTRRYCKCVAVQTSGTTSWSVLCCVLLDSFPIAATSSSPEWQHKRIQLLLPKRFLNSIPQASLPIPRHRNDSFDHRARKTLNSLRIVNEYCKQLCKPLHCIEGQRVSPKLGIVWGRGANNLHNTMLQRHRNSCTKLSLPLPITDQSAWNLRGHLATWLCPTGILTLSQARHLTYLEQSLHRTSTIQIT